MMSRSTSLSEILKVLDTFIEREGHACVPRAHIEGGLRLGDAVDHLRSLNAKGDLPGKAASALQSRSGWFWESGETADHVLVSAVGEFIALQGHAKLKPGTDLAAAADAVRADLADGKLSGHLFDALQSFHEWKWESAYDYGWGDRYRELTAFVELNGHARIPEHINGSSRLAQWASWQRSRYHAGDLPESRRRRLEMIDAWAWRPERAIRQRYVTELIQYIEKHGTHLVPHAFVTDDGYPLGTSLMKIRRDYRNGALAANTLAALENIPGWTWDSPPAVRPINETAVTALRAFVAREGHAVVPTAHTEGEFPLGSYLTEVRFRLRKGGLGASQREALDSVDTGWRRGGKSPAEVAEQLGIAA